MAARILALDLGWAMGWALVNSDAGVVTFGESAAPVLPADQIDLRMGEWYRNLKDLTRRLEPTEIHYELAFQRGQQAARVYGGHWALTNLRALGLNLRAVGMHSGTLKKAATGKGNAKKPEMIAAAGRFLTSWSNEGFTLAGPHIDKMTDNTADAVCLAWVASGKVDSPASGDETHGQDDADSP